LRRERDEAPILSLPLPVLRQCEVKEWPFFNGNSRVSGANRRLAVPGLEQGVEGLAEGRGHGEVWQVAGGVELFEGSGGRWRKLAGRAGVDVEGDAVVGDGVTAGGEEGKVGHGFGGALGEFPEAFPPGSRLLGEEEGVVWFADEEDVFGDGHGGPFRFLAREVFRIAGLAEGADRAVEAVGFAQGAVGLPEFHEGGVELARMGGIDQGRRAVPEEGLAGGGVDRGGVVEEAGEDAGDVGIDDGDGLAEGKGGDCPGGVASEAGEGQERGGIARERAIVMIEDGLGGLLEIADAVVVAEAFPGFEELRFTGRGEGGDIGKSGEESLEPTVLPDCGDGGLLEHDLRDENGVGIGCLPPGVVFAVGIKPPEQGAAEGAGVLQGVLGRRWFQGRKDWALIGEGRTPNMGGMAVTSYTAEISAEAVAKLRKILERDGFEMLERPYAHYGAKKGKLNVTVYEKGPKVLVQGKETEEFVQFTLEPEVLGEARLGYEEVTNPEMFTPHFGIDESGKGDFFGPLVIAGAYVDATSARALLDAGVMDSKRIGSATRIAKLAKVVRGTRGVKEVVVAITPERYNELYDSFRNLNELLAWGHATVIAELAKKEPTCPRALSDQFANPRVLERALGKKGVSIELEQKTKGESDVAVAAASILARERFVRWMREEGENRDMELPLGAGPKVLEAGRAFLSKYGVAEMGNVAKMHFKTAAEIQIKSD
jgi:ribonuclease HIII